MAAMFGYGQHCYERARYVSLLWGTYKGEWQGWAGAEVRVRRERAESA